MKNSRISKLRFIQSVALSLFMICLISTVSSAQEYPKTTLGIKGGINFSNFYKENVEDKNVRTGYNAGIYARLKVVDGFSIQPELLYTTNGAEATYQSLANSRAALKLDYLQVPLLAVINIGPYFNIHGGPYVSYLASAKIQNKSSNSDFNFERDVNKDSFKSIDYGLVGGAGFDINKLHFGARYNYGLNKIGKDQTIAGGTYTFPDVKNSAVQIYVGVDLF